uniref:Uncharacterized protein n=1 Tax=Panagrolaimus sp. PS1159 TaxID=55785 RepID=A0AC35GMV3_9BILA
MSERKSPDDYGQPESPTEEYNPNYYEQHEQNYHQQDTTEDLGPPASPDGSPDYRNEYADAPSSPIPEEVEAPKSPEEEENPKSPEEVGEEDSDNGKLRFKFFNV